MSTMKSKRAGYLIYFLRCLHRSAKTEDKLLGTFGTVPASKNNNNTILIIIIKRRIANNTNLIISLNNNNNNNNCILKVS